jgi:hypothetical protein
MPQTKRKTTPKGPHPHHVPLGMALLIAMVFVLTAALIYVWKIFPHTPAYVPPKVATSTIPTVPAIPDATSTPATPAPDCGNHGHWNGTDCLCGGIAGWSCPVDQECGDLKPTPTTPDALGTCHAKPVTVREAPAGMICDETNSICVDPSFAKTTLTSPFVASGTIIAFENTIAWKLIDADGVEYSSGTILADPSDSGDAANFKLREFLFYTPRTASGTLEFYENSAKDGHPIHAVKIPVRLPQQEMAVKIFLTPYDIGNDCTVVNPVTRYIVRSNLPIEATLRKLLGADLGPGDNTAIPNGTDLVSLSVSHQTATVVFSRELENYGGGSCYASAIRAQIEKTLTQFSTVNNVVISVPGKTPEETLQP